MMPVPVQGVRFVALETVALSPNIGAEIKVDKKTLLEGHALAAELRDLLERRVVLIARGLDFDDSEQLAFAKMLGRVRIATIIKEGDRGILKVSFDKTLNPDFYKGFLGTFSWHMDGPYEPVPPWATILTARVLSPTGGQTEFANTYAAYENLPEGEKKYLESIQVLHSVEVANRFNQNPEPEMVASWRKIPTRVRPLIWVHRSGRKSLVIGASADHVVGMERNESDALLNRLVEWSTQPRFVYQHQWRLGDMVIWDNTGALHRVLPYDMESGRRLHRVTLESDEV